MSVIKDWQLGPLTPRVQNGVWHMPPLHTCCGRKEQTLVATVSLLLLFGQGGVTGHIPLEIISHIASTAVMSLLCQLIQPNLSTKVSSVHMSLFYTPYILVLYRSVLFV